MFSASAAAIAATLFASVGLAAPFAPIVAREDFSQNFTLVVTSTGSETIYQNEGVAACHSGAAIEALCVGFGTTPFQFNASSEAPILPGDTNPGSVVFAVEGEPDPFYQDLSFIQNSTSNVQAAFFGGSDNPAWSLSFNEEQQLGLVVSDHQTDYTWYVCPQSLLGYQYNTVSFVNVGDVPDNTECTPVEVLRVF